MCFEPCVLMIDGRFKHWNLATLTSWSIWAKLLATWFESSVSGFSFEIFEKKFWTFFRPNNCHIYWRQVSSLYLLYRSNHFMLFVHQYWGKFLLHRDMKQAVEFYLRRPDRFHFFYELQTIAHSTFRNKISKRIWF